MDRLITINERLKALTIELKDFSKTLEFEPICEFTTKEIDSIPWKNLQHPGIYLIEIKNSTNHADFKTWVAQFQNEWENPKYRYEFVPNLKKIRIRKHSELKDWIPIYIGKSKNVGGRLHEHIFKELEKRTYALKLNAREHAHKERFKFSLIRLPIDNYDWVASVIESIQRNKINPLIGRQ